MTSTHEFIWETCNEPGIIRIDLIIEEIDTECEVKVRRCCESHIDEDKHKDHESHRIGLVINTRDKGKLWQPFKIPWVTKENVMGPARVTRVNLQTEK